MEVNHVKKYLPLSESTFYILLSLVEPLHGYGVMKEVEHISEGTVSVGPGTLYGAFSTLKRDGLIEMVKLEARRKKYMLTEKGRAVLIEQARRLEIMSRIGQSILGKRVGDNEFK